MSELNQAVHTIQFLAVDAVEKANSGHPGTPMALAGIGVELFTQGAELTNGVNALGLLTANGVELVIGSL